MAVATWLYDAARHAVSSRGMEREAAVDLLGTLGLPAELHDVPPATFSGGQRQMVNLALTLCREQPVLLLDEATASLDPARRRTALAAIRERKRRGVAVLAVFHDVPTLPGLEDRVLTVRDGVVDSASPARPAGVAGVELAGMDLVPGLVDLHSDCLEARTRPRSGMVLPLPAPMLELDTEVASQGITSHFLCVSLDHDPTKHRSLEQAAETVRMVEDVRAELRVSHHVHLRFEMTGEGLEIAVALAGRPVVGMLSYMGHLPGVGQFRDPAAWEAYYGARVGATATEVSRRLRLLDQVDERRRAVAALAHDAGLVLASHDDDTAESAGIAAEAGARICEFPVTLGAAEAAARLGLGIVMGAPNARRGRSQHDNLSARDALRRGLLTALASDYHPASLLCSAYELAADRECSWADALAVVTECPARLAELAGRGRIREGAAADMVAIGRRAGRPSVTQGWRAGERVLGRVPAGDATA